MSNSVNQLFKIQAIICYIFMETDVETIFRKDPQMRQLIIV